MDNSNMAEFHQQRRSRSPENRQTNHQMQPSFGIDYNNEQASTDRSAHFPERVYSNAGSPSKHGIAAPPNLGPVKVEEPELPRH